MDEKRLLPPGSAPASRNGVNVLSGTPGMGQVHATQDQLNAMAQRCEDTGQHISTGMAQLLDRIQALSGSGMEGTANNALQGVSVQLNDGLTKIINALDELA